MKEWVDAEGGDARRTQRVIALRTVLAQRPGASRPKACGAYPLYGILRPSPPPRKNVGDTEPGWKVDKSMYLQNKW